MDPFVGQDLEVGEEEEGGEDEEEGADQPGSMGNALRVEGS